MLISLDGRIHRQKNRHIDFSPEEAGIIVIGKRREAGSFQQGADFAGRLTKVYGRADNQMVCLVNALKDWREIVLDIALAGFFNSPTLAAKATPALGQVR